MTAHPPHAESMLGFDRVRSCLQEHLLSTLGEAALKHAALAKSLPEVRTRMGRIGEFQQILQQQRGVPLEDLVDARETLAKLGPEDAYVSGEALWDIRRVCRAARLVRQWFADGTFSELAILTSRLVEQRALEEHLENMLTPHGEVKSSASATLAEIRDALQRRKEQLRARLLEVMRQAQRQGYAAELPITVRRGRMVIPIRAEAKRKIKGLIHGMSASMQTVFIEPLACFELGNDVQLLEEKERQEVIRLLRQAAAQVRAQGEALDSNMAVLGALDLVQAAAQLSEKLGAVLPKLNRRGVVDIRQARSPSLLLHLESTRDVVPLDLSLNEDVRTLIITGPNAGGKTVAMKTVGLLSIMVAYGLPVPVHPTSNLCLFKKVMVEIGDNQSIEHDLSTFSARIQGLGAMVAKARRGTLVLIDEIGTGTDPAEGAALAQSALEHCTEAGARTIVTTHHGTLKAYAHQTGGVENGSMEFDQASLEPTFVFRQGLPGSSYAFLIAERLRLDGGVLTRARALLGRTQESLESLLLAVQAQRKELAEKIKAQEGVLVRSRIFRPSRPRPKRVARKGAAKPHKPQPGRARPARTPSHITVGARVHLDEGAAVGEVTAIEGERVAVSFGAMRVQVKAKRLRLAKDAPEPRAKPRAMQSGRYVLDLRGCRAGDAVREVEKFMDNALRSDAPAVQIVHGKGTGALREAIHEYLKASSITKEYTTPEVNPGVTYVRLA